MLLAEAWGHWRPVVMLYGSGPTLERLQAILRSRMICVISAGPVRRPCTKWPRGELRALRSRVDLLPTLGVPLRYAEGPSLRRSRFWPAEPTALGYCSRYDSPPCDQIDPESQAGE